MNPFTPLHRTKMGSATQFGRAALRIAKATAQPGLFDLVPGAGQKRNALRALQMLGEAFSLTPQALQEWMDLLTHEKLPSPNGPLLSDFDTVLGDLLMTAQALALYQQAQGQGDELLVALGAAAPLRDLGDARALGQLEAEIERFAPHLMQALPSLRNAGALHGHMGGLRDLRKRLSQMGLTGSGWRWLLRQLPFNVLGSGSGASEPPKPEFWICQANWFGAVGPDFVPHPQLVDLLWDEIHDIDLHTLPLEDYPWLLSVAHEQCLQVHDDPGALWYLLEICVRRMLLWVLLFDWSPDANQRRSGWQALDRACQRAAALPAGTQDLSWPAPVASVSLGGLTARALQTTRALVEEGWAMHHCVADYAAQAANGRFLAYSVTLADGKRVATLSIERHPEAGIWRAHDIKAQFNRPVTDEALAGLLAKTVELANTYSSHQAATGCCVPMT